MADTVSGVVHTYATAVYVPNPQQPSEHWVGFGHRTAQIVGSVLSNAARGEAQAQAPTQYRYIPGTGSGPTQRGDLHLYITQTYSRLTNPSPTAIDRARTGYSTPAASGPGSAWGSGCNSPTPSELSTPELSSSPDFGFLIGSGSPRDTSPGRDQNKPVR
jgi:hypothetical protein